ncbi:MAG: MSMEG_0568 family radical SAM protein [Pseudomonadota bacterium]
MQHLITEIQSFGIAVPAHIQGRQGGAGPAEGRAFLIDGIAVNAPIAGHYVSRSPFSLRQSGSAYVLCRDGREIADLDVVPEPAFYSGSTKDGIPYRQIALLHGKDCLASTVLQRCVHWKRSTPCRFCATETSLKNKATLTRKRPDQLAEVARAARDQDKITHMVLTSGTGDPPGSEIPLLAACARAVRKKAGIPVQVQFAPPLDLSLMDELFDAGVESVGIHVESFDPPTLQRMAPAKAAIGMDRFEQAWKRAVELFGPNQVSSFIIAGLGEPPESIAWGSEYLADLGVYPFVVPLRPIPGSILQDYCPPGSDSMKRIYDAVAGILQAKGLRLDRTRAGCVRCGACSALPAYHTPEVPIVCHSARTREEREGALSIRHAVFVEEQGMFTDSDLDRHDTSSVLLVAKHNGRLIGTVRIYPDPLDNAPQHWVGGRLAVHREARATRAGSLLVREAMRRVKKKGCTLFTALIQEQNVPFFNKLGWKAQGPMQDHFGHLHQPMIADLDRVPGDL